MRRFTIVVLIICTLSILLFLYMEHDTKKFIKTISDPVSTTDQRNAPPEEKAEPLSIEETPLVDTQDSQEIVDEGTTPTHVHQTDHTHPHDHTADTHIRVRIPLFKQYLGIPRFCFHLLWKPNLKRRTI